MNLGGRTRLPGQQEDRKVVGFPSPAWEMAGVGWKKLNMPPVDGQIPLPPGEREFWDDNHPFAHITSLTAYSLQPKTYSLKLKAYSLWLMAYGF